MTDLSEIARRRGPLEAGGYRVVVYEATGGISSKDFGNRVDAERYANDAASETEHGIVQAYVLDGNFEVVYTGAHY